MATLPIHNVSSRLTHLTPSQPSDSWLFSFRFRCLVVFFQGQAAKTSKLVGPSVTCITDMFVDCALLLLQHMISVWQFSAQAGPPFGAVSFWIFQTRSDGARMIIFRDVVRALQMAEKGIVNAAKDAKAELIRIKGDSAERRQLAAAGALTSFKADSDVWVMRLSHLIKMLPQKPDHNRILPLLQTASQSTPPPVYNRRLSNTFTEKQGSAPEAAGFKSSRAAGQTVGEAAASSAEKTQQPDPAATLAREVAATALRALSGTNANGGGSLDTLRFGALPPRPVEEEEGEEDERPIFKRPVVPRLIRAKLGR